MKMELFLFSMTDKVSVRREKKFYSLAEVGFTRGFIGKR